MKFEAQIFLAFFVDGFSRKNLNNAITWGVGFVDHDSCLLRSSQQHHFGVLFPKLEDHQRLAENIS